MTQLTEKLAYIVTRTDRRTVKLVLLIVSLSLFILGAGAPDSDGGIGG